MLRFGANPWTHVSCNGAFLCCGHLQIQCRTYTNFEGFLYLQWTKTFKPKKLLNLTYEVSKRECQMILSNLPNLQWTINKSFKNWRHIIKNP
jgi:hypothetical protein